MTVAIDPELLSMFRQVVHVAKPMGVSSSGDNVYGNPSRQTVRQEPISKLLDTQPTGESVVSEYRLFFTSPIGLKDHIWLAGVDPTDERLARMPKQVAPQPDEDGTISHYEVYV